MIRFHSSRSGSGELLSRRIYGLSGPRVEFRGLAADAAYRRRVDGAPARSATADRDRRTLMFLRSGRGKRDVLGFSRLTGWPPAASLPCTTPACIRPFSTSSEPSFAAPQWRCTSARCTYRRLARPDRTGPGYGLLPDAQAAAAAGVVAHRREPWSRFAPPGCTPRMYLIPTLFALLAVLLVRGVENRETRCRVAQHGMRHPRRSRRSIA